MTPRLRQYHPPGDQTAGAVPVLDATGRANLSVPELTDLRRLRRPNRKSSLNCEPCCSSNSDALNQEQIRDPRRPLLRANAQCVTDMSWNQKTYWTLWKAPTTHLISLDPLPCRPTQATLGSLWLTTPGNWMMVWSLPGLPGN